jgi:hypothetical protein
VTRSLFRDVRVGRGLIEGVAFVTALLGCSATAVEAQSLIAPGSLRVSFESIFEAVEDGSPRARALGGSRLGVELAHERTSRRGALRLWTGLLADPSPEIAGTRSLASSTDVTGRLTLTRRTRLEFSERISATPTDLFASFGAAAPVTGSRTVVVGSELQNARTLSHNGRASVTHALGTRTQAVFYATHSISRSERDRVVASGVGGSIARRVGVHVGWHAGYGLTLTDSQQAAAGHVAHVIDRRHDLDLGLDYARSLPFSRRTKFGLTTGATVLTLRDGRRLRGNNTARIEHRLTQAWSISGDYTRPIEHVAGLVEPLVSDAVRVSAAGRLPGKIAVALSAGRAVGTLGMSGGPTYASYSGSLTVSRPLGPNWLIQAVYQDASYQFESPPGGSIPAAFSRRGVRMSLGWSPMRGGKISKS